jgi:hypothetical protein
VPKYSLNEAQNRLAEALNRLERLEANPRAEKLALNRARISVGVWRNIVKRLSREPQQRVLPWRT